MVVIVIVGVVLGGWGWVSICCSAACVIYTTGVRKYVLTWDAGDGGGGGGGGGGGEGGRWGEMNWTELVIGRQGGREGGRDGPGIPDYFVKY